MKTLSRDCYRILKHLAKHNGCAGFIATSSTLNKNKDDDNLDHLLQEGLIVQLPPFSEQGKELPHYKRVYKIQPAGLAAIELARKDSMDRWITRGISIAALLISAIALFK